MQNYKLKAKKRRAQGKDEPGDANKKIKRDISAVAHRRIDYGGSYKALKRHITPEKDLRIASGDWEEMNASFSPEQIMHGMVELKLRGEMRLPPSSATTAADARSDFSKLCAVELGAVAKAGATFRTKSGVPSHLPALGLLSMSRIGLRSSDHFHHDLRCLVGSKGLPASARWESLGHLDARMLRCIWISSLTDITPSKMRTALHSHLGVAGQFRPAAARAIYQLYGGGNVLDFSGGWGDRLAAASTLQGARAETLRTGIEPSPEADGRALRQRGVDGSQMPLTVHARCAEDIMPSLGTSTFDMVFTSPPYHNAEKYETCTSDASSQSHIKVSVQVSIRGEGGSFCMWAS
jgi:hypothetical protein